MELGDRFYAPAAPTTIFGNRLISLVSTVGDTPSALFPRYYLLHFDYLRYRKIHRSYHALDP